MTDDSTKTAVLRADIDQGLADAAAGRVRDFDRAKIIERGRGLLNAGDRVARMVEDLDESTLSAIASSAVPDEFAHLDQVLEDWKLEDGSAETNESR